jgi:hypothetical protein
MIFQTNHCLQSDGRPDLNNGEPSARDSNKNSTTRLKLSKINSLETEKDVPYGGNCLPKNTQIWEDS